jgi:hypothetical protein
MTGLANLALEYLILIMFGSDDEIDPDYSFKMTGMVPEYLGKLSDAERAALSEAAAGRIARMQELNPNIHENSDVFAFLGIVSSGKVFDGSEG